MVRRRVDDHEEEQVNIDIMEARVLSDWFLIRMWIQNLRLLSADDSCGWRCRRVTGVVGEAVRLLVVAGALDVFLLVGLAVGPPVEGKDVGPFIVSAAVALLVVGTHVGLLVAGKARWSTCR